MLRDDRMVARGGGWQGPGELAGLLNDVVAFVRSYVVMAPPQADAVALWIAHTHVLDAAESTPYLNITGPAMRVGKSRLLDVLALLVRRPIEAANISEAALFRLVGGDDETPPATLLFDEIDSVFGARAKDKEELRGLLNAGHRRGAVSYRMVGEGSKMRPQPFPVFSPKAFAGIGDKLPQTLADRSVRISLKRKTRDEQVSRFRRREAEGSAVPLRDRLTRWGVESVDALGEARPELPDELDDRAQDGWEILLAVADAAGGGWPGRARRAAIRLSGGREEEESLAVQLLWLIKAAFDEPGRGDRMSTAEIVTSVAIADESPFSDWWNEKERKPEKKAANRMAELLKGFGIQSKQRKIDGINLKGFERGWFEDAWQRFPAPAVEESSLPGGSEPSTPSTSHVPSGESTLYQSLYPTLYVEGSVDDQVEGFPSSPEPHVEGVDGSVQGDGRDVPTSHREEARMRFSDEAIDAILPEVAARHPDIFPPGTPEEQIREQIPTVIEAELVAEGERLLEVRRPRLIRSDQISPGERRRLALVEVAGERARQRAAA